MLRKIFYISLIILAIVYFCSDSPNQNIFYVPCATDSKDIKFEQVDTSSEMIGKNNVNQLFIASDTGSFIQPKSGLNYIILGNKGANKIYFNLMLTNIVDNQVSVIKGFNPKKDKLEFFSPIFTECSHFNVIHSYYKKEPVTYIEIKTKKNNVLTAIALLGNIVIKPEDLQCSY